MVCRHTIAILMGGERSSSWHKTYYRTGKCMARVFGCVYSLSVQLLCQSHVPSHATPCTFQKLNPSKIFRERWSTLCILYWLVIQAQAHKMRRTSLGLCPRQKYTVRGFQTSEQQKIGLAVQFLFSIPTEPMCLLGLCQKSHLHR